MRRRRSHATCFWRPNFWQIGRNVLERHFIRRCASLRSDLADARDLVVALGSVRMPTHELICRLERNGSEVNVVRHSVSSETMIIDIIATNAYGDEGLGQGWRIRLTDAGVFEAQTGLVPEDRAQLFLLAAARLPDEIDGSWVDPIRSGYLATVDEALRNKFNVNRLPR